MLYRLYYRHAYFLSDILSEVSCYKSIECGPAPEKNWDIISSINFSKHVTSKIPSVKLNLLGPQIYMYTKSVHFAVLCGSLFWCSLISKTFSWLTWNKLITELEQSSSYHGLLEILFTRFLSVGSYCDQTWVDVTVYDSSRALMGQNGGSCPQSPHWLNYSQHKGTG